MELLAANGQSFVLDTRLKEFERIELNPEFVIYQQCLAQQHLPTEKWIYEKGKPGLALVERETELEEMDAVLFREMDYSTLVSPMRLYRYYLLQQLLGNNLNYGGIGIVRAQKSHFVFLDTPFSWNKMKGVAFESNALSHMLLKRGKKKDLKRTHEAFFVLMDEKFQSRLLNALTQYQSETGQLIPKTELIEALMDKHRLLALKGFSNKLIERL